MVVYIVWKCPKCSEKQVSYTNKTYEYRDQWWLNCKFCKHRRTAYKLRRYYGFTPNTVIYYIGEKQSEARRVLMEVKRSGK